jgi:hypothetical protein
LVVTQAWIIETAVERKRLDLYQPGASPKKLIGLFPEEVKAISIQPFCPFS